MASLYPSGHRPPGCPEGHEWRGGDGSMLVGTTNCTCLSARSNFRVHVYVRCRGDGDICGWEWADPSCDYQVPHDSEWPGFYRARRGPAR